MAVEGTNEKFVRRHPPIGLCARHDRSEFSEKLGNESLNVCFDAGSSNVIGCLKIQSEIVFLDALFVQRFIPKAPIKEHKLVHVPCEEKLRLRLVGFVICVFHQCMVIWVAPFGSARQFDFSSEHQLVWSIVDPKVGTLSCLAERLFDFDPFKWQLRVLFEKFVSPRFNSSAKTYLVCPYIR